VTHPVAPAERVRARVARAVGPEIAARLPRGYQRLGRILVLRLAESLRPQFELIGEAWRAETGVVTVLRHAGRTEGEWRRPRMERIAGDETETEVHENGIRYRLDAERIMFAAGNRSERGRAGSVTRAGEHVVDLFAGIGYFTLPAAVLGRAGSVTAVETNPLAFDYLVRNAAFNGVGDRVHARLGDNRSVELPFAEADRVFLGYLPSSVGWIPRALGLLRPSGGWLHVHLLATTREGLPEAERAVSDAVDRAGGRVDQMTSREVKPYGPGRLHAVVDVRAVPR
jgi:tRNA wybutosine-synthesizing protein 2